MNLMNLESLKTKAGMLRDLHSGPRMLVLPNAWDAASAKIIERCGFSALATTSSGVAGSLGYPDGERVTRELMLEVVARIAGVVGVPVTADLEAGYGPLVEDVVRTVHGLLEAGAVGLNFEDSRPARAHALEDLGTQVDKIKAIREAAVAAGVPVVLNARVDVLLYGQGNEAARVAETIHRANAYRDAGADCVFPIGVRSGETVATLVREIKGPVNILFGPGLPSIVELERMGVRRVTFDSGLMRAANTHLRSMMQALRDQPSGFAIPPDLITNQDLSDLLAR